MQRLAERQRQFAAALLDPELPPPSGLVGPDGEPSPRRFGVYRNNVVAGLTEALSDAFPAVCRIVGVEFFRAMARPFVISRPPDTPIMLEYGARFPDFVDSRPPRRFLIWRMLRASNARGWKPTTRWRPPRSRQPRSPGSSRGDFPTSNSCFTRRRGSSDRGFRRSPYGG